MSSSLSKTLNVGFLLVTMALSLLLFTGATNAQENDGNFSYTAERGDNLTLLVRQSVEELAKNDSVQLSDGQLIAAETQVVQELGAFELNVGQEVNIERGIVQSGLNQATELSETELARWAAFGPITRSSERPEVTAIGDTTEEATQEPEVAEEPEQNPEEESAQAETTEDSEQQTVEVVEPENQGDLEVNTEAPATADVLENAIGSTGKANTDNTAEDTEDDSSTAPWYWWVIGGSALGAMWYILGGGGSKKADPAKKSTKKQPTKQNAKTKKAKRK